MLKWPDRLAYCVANVAAVLVALYVAFWLGLDRPYWSMFTVFIVSKPISGAVRAKGIFRLFGTLAGASMSVFLVPPLVQSPALLSLATGAWIAGCLFGALQDRTPRSYAFQLAGFSVAIVGLSAVNNPTTIFDVAVSRLEEVIIGIICAAIAHSVFFPKNFAEILRHKAESALHQLAIIAANAIGTQPRAPSTHDVGLLSSTVTQLHTLYSQISFETSNVRRAPSVMVAILDRISTSVPQASLAFQALTARTRLGTLPGHLRSALGEAEALLIALPRGSSQNTDTTLARLADLSRELDNAKITPDKILEQAVLQHTLGIIRALREGYRLLPGLIDASFAPVEDLLLPARTLRPLHRDQLIACLSAASAAGATLVACCLWIETAWPEGFVAAQFAAICCSLFATLDNPSKAIGRAVLSIVVALPFAALYSFAILPALDGYPSLALALLPMLVIFSFLQTHEQFEGVAIVLAVSFSGALALQGSFASDFSAFANSNLAELCGALIAASMLAVFRTIDPIWNANRILKSGRLSLGDIASGPIDPAGWTLTMFDRIGLAAVRHCTFSEASSRDLIRDLRVGLNLLALQTVETIIPRKDALKLADTVARVWATENHPSFTFLRRTAVQDTEALAEHVLSASCTEQRRQSLVALTGLRLDLESLSESGIAT